MKNLTTAQSSFFDSYFAGISFSKNKSGEDCLRFPDSFKDFPIKTDSVKEISAEAGSPDSYKIVISCRGFVASKSNVVDPASFEKVSADLRTEIATLVAKQLVTDSVFSIPNDVLSIQQYQKFFIRNSSSTIKVNGKAVISCPNMQPITLRFLSKGTEGKKAVFEVHDPTGNFRYKVLLAHHLKLDNSTRKSLISYAVSELAEKQAEIYGNPIN